jgi:hypothetical protein
MRKSLMLMYLIILVAMYFGSLKIPQSSFFWFASTDALHQYVRVLLASVLVIQLVTRPPRRIWIRSLTGFIGFVVMVWALRQSYNNNMLLLDSLSVIGASIVIIVTSLEHKAIKIRSDIYSLSDLRV